MTTDMALAIGLLGPLAWLCLRGEVHAWMDARKRAERDTRARIVRELRHHHIEQASTQSNRSGALR